MSSEAEGVSFWANEGNLIPGTMHRVFVMQVWIWRRYRVIASRERRTQVLVRQTMDAEMDKC